MKFLVTMAAGILLFNSSLSAQQQEKSKEAAWAALTSPVLGISKDSAKKKWGVSSTQFMAWEELSRQQYQQKGIIFFEKYPDDRRFNDWFIKTTGENRPAYWKDPMACAQCYTSYLTKGTPLVCEFDEQSKTRWDMLSLSYTAKYLADTSVTEKQKKDFSRGQQFGELAYISDKLNLGQGNLGAQLSAAMPSLIQLGGELSSNNSLSAMLYLASHDRELEKKILSAMKASPDSNEQRTAYEQQALFDRLREKPVSLKLPSLDGAGVINLENYRGKVVMLDFWNIHCGSCISHMPKFKRIYEQFKDKGFVLVSVCVIGYDGKGNEEAEVKKALAIEKKYQLTYPSAKLLTGFVTPSTGRFAGVPMMNVDDPTWKFFDCPAGGAIFILDQYGKLVTNDQSGQWMEYEIRRLLGLPLDSTGKQ